MCNCNKNKTIPTLGAAAPAIPTLKSIPAPSPVARNIPLVPSVPATSAPAAVASAKTVVSVKKEAPTGKVEAVKVEAEAVQTVEPKVEPARTGACPFCLRKHLLKARGYADEVREDATREWEREKLLENLLLAEDHADALGESGLKEAIRDARLEAEEGGVPVLRALVMRAQALVAGSLHGGNPALDTKG